ncbi:hypothetical protein T492DRAFT_562681, partial [Pavlovales sp. CCMP2436]
AAVDARKYTALAPLGAANARIGGEKQTGLSLVQLAAILARDVSEGAHGRGGYFVSGDLTPEVFSDDALFVDPTNSVSLLARYSTALSILFDPLLSTASLVAGPTVDESARTISARVRLSGTLKLPWRPYIAPYETDIVWTVGSSGLVVAQEQVWSISAFDALHQTFTP